jgi:hypothetical protein
MPAVKHHNAPSDRQPISGIASSLRAGRTYAMETIEDNTLFSLYLVERYYTLVCSFVSTRRNRPQLLTGIDRQSVVQRVSILRAIAVSVITSDLRRFSRQRLRGPTLTLTKASSSTISCHDAASFA